MYYSLEGLWEAKLEDGTRYEMHLPGTLDENKIGYRDTGANQWHPDAGLGNAGEGFDPDAPIATRFTRKYTYEGAVEISRNNTYTPPEGKRIFLEAERARCLRLLVDGKEMEPVEETSISTPYIFEVTGHLKNGCRLTLISDNSYPGLPHDDIVFSSAATDETQTNWNGVLGYLRFRAEDPVFLSALRVYPSAESLTVQVEIDADRAYQGTLTVKSEALKEPVSQEISAESGKTQIILENLPLASDVRRWDEYEGNLYRISASLTGCETKTVPFGVRTFGDNGSGRLALNGRTIFLRSEANCAEFPETGHPPMSVEEWTKILSVYKSYGVNCMRFHSHCPPEAAFFAADDMGMLMQPELSHWNPRNAFVAEESYACYQKELRQIIRTLANHPSFVMLTLGNELWTDETGHQRMSQLLKMARELDSTRLYADGSNVHYGTIGCGQDSDFYTSQSWFDKDLRGTFAAMGKEKTRIKGYINNQYPNARTSYDDTLKHLRKSYQKPVFSFEVGQFEVLPDFDELEEFHGVSDPANLRLIQEKVKKLGLENVWKRYVEATGELSRIGYREEIEAAMRTEELSGISLLGLQDFPGQGTALVGMLNSHLEPKPFDFAEPQQFRKFFTDALVLVKLPAYTYQAGDTLRAEITAANFSKKEICGQPRYCITGKNIQIEGQLPQVKCPAGKLTAAGILEIPLEGMEQAVRLDLTVTIGEMINTYPIWVYPETQPVCPSSVYETKVLDEQALQVLDAGGRVYLSPSSDREHLPRSIQAQFTTDFWSVGTFPAQEGGMGQLIDETHPIFEEFPTEFHTNWQWWPMASQRAVILPRPVKAIVTEMDSYAYMRPMAQLLECRCGKGKILFSSMGLQDLQQYPEARALLTAIYHYMDSERFLPDQEMTVEEIRGLVR